MRKKLQEFTSSMDIKKQFELITGKQRESSLTGEPGDLLSPGSSALPTPASSMDSLSLVDRSHSTESFMSLKSAPSIPEIKEEPSDDEDEENAGKSKHHKKRESTSSIASSISQASLPPQGDVAPPPRAMPADRRSSRRGGVIKFEEEREIKRKEKIENIIQEIQASEALYYKFLSILSEHFIKPMRERKLVSPETLDLIFSNIEQVAPYHKVIADELMVEDVSVVYSKYAEYLKVYAKYVNNYDVACDTVAALKKNKEFQKSPSVSFATH